MKKIINISFLILCFICNAQNPIYNYNNIPNNIPNGCYIKDMDNHLNKFVGTWKFSDNNVEFTLVLHKLEMVSHGNIYIDEITGYFIYKINNVTIIDTSSNPNTEPSICCSLFFNSNFENISVQVFDIERPKISFNAYLSYSIGLNDNSKYLNWKLSTFLIPKLPGQPAPLYDIRLPNNLTLIKQ
jgi:hypothetical protein